MLLFILPCASVHAAPPTEHEVKAAFIHNIAKFVEWPALPRAGDSLRLCIMGQSPLAETAGLLAGKHIGELVWEVRRIGFRESLQECHVLFIAASESDNLRSILKDIRGSGVLTVGDSGGYAERGVMVNFYPEENKVHFEINVDVVRRSGLKISSQLLKLARIVHESGEMQ
jgi:hypothetical protein